MVFCRSIQHTGAPYGSPVSRLKNAIGLNLGKCRVSAGRKWVPYAGFKKKMRRRMKSSFHSLSRSAMLFLSSPNSPIHPHLISHPSTVYSHVLIYYISATSFFWSYYRDWYILNELVLFPLIRSTLYFQCLNVNDINICYTWYISWMFWQISPQNLDSQSTINHCHSPTLTNRRGATQVY